MKKLLFSLTPVLFLLVSSLVSCELTADRSRMEGEEPYLLTPAQRERLSGLFGAAFVAESESRIFAADFTSGANDHHPILGGRRLAGVYDPSRDKIWIDWSTGTEAVVAHELTHRWQMRHLRDPLPSQGDRLSMGYTFEDEALEAAVAGGFRLNCEQEANLMSLFYLDDFQRDPRRKWFEAYARGQLGLPGQG